jgi:hypothetical protein
VEHVPQSLQCTAHCRLAEQQARRRSRDVSFFRKNREYDQQIEVRLA